jgi:small subunit ribosomal protein S16
MVLRIRLQRFGQKKAPFYHIVCCNARTGRQSKPLEKLGTYNPIPKDGVKDVAINYERAKYWIGVGAQPSDTCAKLLEKADLITRRPAVARTVSSQSLKVDLPKAMEGTVLGSVLQEVKGMSASRRVGPRRG